MRRLTLSRTRGPGVLSVGLLLAFCPISALWADAVYKSVDAQGHVVYSDQPDSSVQQSVVQFADSQIPPRVIHFCWTNCFTLVLNNGMYSRADGTEETWSIEHFTPSSVLLHRHDPPVSWNGFNTDVSYAAEVLNNQLVNVTVNGKPVADIHAAFGPALEALPGSNAERDHPVPDSEVSTNQPPPPLPNEEQPPGTQDGALWTPGYWSWGGERYYWVPGAWARAPRVGLLWTPGYWGFAGGAYMFHPGYWGTQVGYYGGINYGFGYTGSGFLGGRWIGESFAYNRAVSNVNISLIHNTYNENVPKPVGANKVSYNGGPGGTISAPTAEEKIVMTQSHIPSSTPQRQTLYAAAGPASPVPGVHKPAPAPPRAAEPRDTHPVQTDSRPAHEGVAAGNTGNTQAAARPPVAKPLPIQAAKLQHQTPN
jgi:hypothetical protein